MALGSICKALYLNKQESLLFSIHSCQVVHNLTNLCDPCCILALNPAGIVSIIRADYCCHIQKMGSSTHWLPSKQRCQLLLLRILSNFQQQLTVLLGKRPMCAAAAAKLLKNPVKLSRFGDYCEKSHLVA